MQHIADVQKTAMNLAYATFASEYNSHPPIYPQITTPLDASRLTNAPLGTRWVGSIGLGDLERRNPGERYSDDTTRDGYVRLMGIRNYGKTHRISMEHLDAAGGEQRYLNDVAHWSKEIAKGSLRKKEMIVADMYQKGTLSAGDKTIFDQSYEANPDTNIGKIYDAKPLMAASGNAHPFKAHTATSTQGVNLTVSLALSTANLQTGLLAVDADAGWDERGNRVLVQHQVLMVPKGLEFTALQILNSTQVAENANNGINVVKNALRPVVNPWLSDSASASSWWTLDPQAIVVFDEQVPRMRQWFDPETNMLCLAVDVFFGAAPQDWRFVRGFNKAVS